MWRSYRISVFIIALCLILLSTASLVAAAPVAQVDTADVVVPVFSRLSWGAVIAGTIITLMIQLALNLLGISFGLASWNPEDNAGEDTPRSFLTESAIWMGATTFFALFIGGWVAGHFAGVPDTTDGLLHGIMVWGVSMILTLLLLLTSVGRIVSSMSSLMGQGLHLLGEVTQGAAHIAGSAARGAAQAAGNIASAAGSDGQRADGPDISLEEIQAEARQLMREAGIAPERVQAEIRNMQHDVEDAVSETVQHPDDAEQQLSTTLARILQRGQRLADSADRDAVVNILTSRTEMDRAEAEAMLSKWEDVAERSRQKAEQVRDQAEQKAHEFQDQAQANIDRVRHEAEQTAREAAQTATDTLAKVAGGLFLAMVIGAFAAGFGGFAGTPDDAQVVVVNADNAP